MDSYSYKGNLHPFAALICHSEDMPRIAPVLEELSKKGLRIHALDESSQNYEAVLEKAFAVLCVLSGNGYNSEKLEKLLLAADTMNKKLIPMRLDEVPMPELISRLFYATNFINLEKYTPSEAVSRITESPVMKNPKRTKPQTRFVRIAGILALAAVLVLGAVGIFGTRSKADTEKPDTPDMSVLARYGLTEEDLAKVRSIVFTGDKLEESSSASSVWDYLVETDEGLVRMEDGSPVEMGGPEDFSFLTMLPNLRNLVLVNQTAARLPDLSSLERLDRVELWNCDFENLEGLRNCSDLQFICISSDYISDLSPLSDCVNLKQADITDCDALKSLAGFCPPSLTELRCDCDSLEDISGLRECSELSNLELRSNKLSDISALSDCTKLQSVLIECRDGAPLSDFSALGNATELQNLRIGADRSVDVSFVGKLVNLFDFSLDCENVSGLENLSACSNLNIFSLEINDEPRAISFDCLARLHSLSDITLSNVTTELSFLEEMVSEKHQKISLRVFGPDISWNGLNAVDEFSRLSVDTWGQNCPELFEAIKNASVDELSLGNCGDYSVSDIPSQVLRLTIDNANLTTLEGLPCTQLRSLRLGKCGRLTSLQGLETLEKLEELDLYDNIRLTDWSAVYAKPLKSLIIERMYLLPDFAEIELLENGSIKLAQIYELTDLSCLDTLSDETVKSGKIDVEIIGDELINLNALLRFKGNTLRVSPLLEEQATDLVDRGCFGQYEVVYPDTDWDLDNVEIELQSLDELDTLPKALLKHVTELCIAADTVYSYDWVPEIREENGVLSTYMCNWSTDEMIELSEMGTEVDFEKLSQLTGLRRLRVGNQKLENLDGIQNFEKLEELGLSGCDIEDYSALFAVDTIERLSLSGDGITSIQGIQNLSNLAELQLRASNVADLSPLREMSFCERVMQEGFSLQLPETWMVEQYPEDLSALAAVPKYNELNMNGYRDVEWISFLAGKDIRYGMFLSMFNGEDAQQKLEEFVNNAGNIGMLNLCWNAELTDLRCLTKLEGLAYVELSSNMTEAIHSLDGVEYGFELRIQG